MQCCSAGLLRPGHHQLRADGNMRRWAQEIASRKLGVQGAKGPSWLSGLLQFHLARSFVPDYTHCKSPGVVKMIIEVWFDSNNGTQVFYLGRPNTVVKIYKLIAPRPPQMVSHQACMMKSIQNESEVRKLPRSPRSQSPGGGGRITP